MHQLWGSIKHAIPTFLVLHKTSLTNLQSGLRLEKGRVIATSIKPRLQKTNLNDGSRITGPRWEMDIPLYGLWNMPKFSNVVVMWEAKDSEGQNSEIKTSNLSSVAPFADTVEYCYQLWARSHRTSNSPLLNEVTRNFIISQRYVRLATFPRRILVLLGGQNPTNTGLTAPQSIHPIGEAWRTVAKPNKIPFLHDLAVR